MCQTVVIVGETIQENDEIFSVEVSVVNSLDDISGQSSFRVTIQDDSDGEKWVIVIAMHLISTLQ